MSFSEEMDKYTMCLNPLCCKHLLKKNLEKVNIYVCPYCEETMLKTTEGEWILENLALEGLESESVLL